mmetsp:Transcript_34267/g.79053  ORF Transcript_34267/g.79053 Transcript_34267/m.79053 type:complete len:86 (+) Transcript_34267:34-291(+)
MYTNWQISSIGSKLAQDRGNRPLYITAIRNLRHPHYRLSIQEKTENNLTLLSLTLVTMPSFHSLMPAGHLQLLQPHLLGPAHPRT